MKGNIYPTKGGWQLRFGKEITRQFKDKGIAEKELTYLRRLADKDQFDPRDHRIKDNPLSFRKLGEKWLLRKKKILRPRSFANLERYMERAIDEWGHTNIKLIQYAQIEDFILDYPVGAKTRANIKSCLHDFFGWVHKRERVPVPDFPDTPFELGWRNIIDIQTQTQIVHKVRDLSYHINPKIWLGIQWLRTYISCRPSELLGLAEKNIRIKMGCFIIPHPKERTPKTIYLLPEDVEILKSIPRGLPDMYFFRHPPGISGARAGQRFGNRYLYKWWKKATADLGIVDVDLYGGTRHSTATALGQICTPEEVRDATGHTSKAFERYFQNKQARALKVTQKIKQLRGEVIKLNVSNKTGN